MLINKRPANVQKLKVVTRGMKDLLIEVERRERLDLEPLPLHAHRSAVGLVKRKLVSINPCPVGGHKNIDCLFLTVKGFEYLQSLGHT